MEKTWMQETTTISEGTSAQENAAASEKVSAKENVCVQTQTAINRTYKSRIFEMIFSDRKELSELYNAVNQTDYKDPEQLEINTLKNAIYMAM